MKRTFLLFFFLPALLFAQYATPGTGVNWTVDSLVAYSGGVVAGSGNTYTIINAVTITANDKVTLRPGLTFTVTGSTSGFQVNGVLNCTGTAVNPITFTAPVADSTGPYNGIQFNDSAIDSLCVVKYTNVNYAYYGVRTIGANPLIENNNFFKCRRGVQLSSSSSIIRNNRIERSYEYGITMTLGSSPLVEGNYILNNNSQNTSPKNQISVGTQNDNSPKIYNNIIEGGMFNKTGGIAISGLLGTSLTSEVVGNTVRNNSFGISIAGSGINTIVKNNLFENNNINPDPLTSGSGINVNGTATNTPIITMNTIRGNWWGITVQNGTTIQAGPNPNIGNLNNTANNDDGLNNIYNNVQGTAVQDLFNNCTNMIYAQNNYWGTNDPAIIEQHITHRVDDTTRGLVDFTQFRPQFVPVELSAFFVTVSGNEVLISWSTATETNCRSFTVYRISAGTALQVASLSGAGTTTTPRYYSIKDIPGNSGTVTYRLVQTDFDGTVNVLSERTVTLNPEGFSVSQNYPNPFNPSTVVDITLPQDAGSVFTITVNSITGEQIYKNTFERSANGVQRIILAPGSSLPVMSAGTYFYTVSSGKYIKTAKMVYLK